MPHPLQVRRLLAGRVTAAMADAVRPARVVIPTWRPTAPGLD